MKLIRQFVVAHPWQSLGLMILLLLAGLADGIGLSAMLPMLNIAFSSSAGAGSGPLSADSISTGSGGDLSGFVVDLLHSLHLTPTLGMLLTVIVAGISAKSLLVFVAEQRIGYLAAEVATRLRLELLGAVTASSWLFYVKQSVGRLANAMATDAWRASTAYVYAIRMLVALVETAVYFVLALAVSWGATLTCLLAGAGVWALSHRFVKISRHAGTGQTRGYRALLTSLTDVLLSIKTLKSMGRERSAQALVADESNALRRDLRGEVLGNAGLDAGQEPLYTLVIVVGAYVALVHLEMEFATVTFLALVLTRLLKQGSAVQKQYQRMITCESAYWSLEDTIDDARRQAERVAGGRPPRFAHAIALEDVSFGYDEGAVITRADLVIPYGGITCLTGESGSGKSTIADLVIGLIAPTRGRILVDGVDLHDIDLDAWRRTIGYVPQENLLLHDTVHANVTLGDESLTDADVQRALEAAGAATFVAAMEEGVDTVVGERGARLSGGQRQRIMIARALAHRPSLLVLDEATSALDTAAEADICATLAALRGSLTILAVTHQSALRRIADVVYEVEQGTVRLVKGVPGAAPASDVSDKERRQA